ncbi:MAG: Bifunctional purine biosynthesis protein PurH [Parcubacteria group bacterium GW2011_GWA2_51_10]|nr:MAG: Bifunctional purine biosynthesis protein PurH [Parcubacteria group bacterium GW2011_GWA2_51_10]
MKTELKYGENPHQRASALIRETTDPLAIQNFKSGDAAPFVGSGASWISITDLGRLLVVAERFAAAYRKNVRRALPHLAAIVKHGSPCGAAFGGDSAEVAAASWAGDPQAAFGGFFLCTFPFTKKVAAALKDANAGKMPFLSVAAPSLQSGIEEYIGAKAATRYFIANPALAKIPDHLVGGGEVKSVRDLTLEQEAFNFIPDFAHMERHGTALSGKDAKIVFADLSLAYAVASSSTSNTVTLVKNGRLIGNAVGQQKRLGSAKLALRLAKENGHDVKGAVAVSDSFFPFPDGLEVLAKAGVRAVFATSGSVRDKDVFAAAEKLKVALFTVPDKEGRMFAGH